MYFGEHTKISEHDSGLLKEGGVPSPKFASKYKDTQSLVKTFGGLHICNSKLNLYYEILACNHEEVHKCWVFLHDENSPAIYLCNLFFYLCNFLKFELFLPYDGSGPLLYYTDKCPAQTHHPPRLASVCTNPVLTDMVTLGGVSEWPRMASIPQLESRGKPWSSFSEVSAYTRAAVTRSILLWCCQKGGGSAAHHSARWLVTPLIVLPLCQVCPMHFTNVDSQGRYNYYPHCTDEGTEAPDGSVTSPRSCSQEVLKLGMKPAVWPRASVTPPCPPK